MTGAVSIRAFAVALMLFVLTPLLAYGAYLFVRYERLEEARIEREALSIARRGAASLDRELESSRAALQALAVTWRVGSKSLGEFHAEAVEVARVMGVDVELRDAQGRRLMTTRVPLGAPLPPGVPESAIRALPSQQAASVTDLEVRPGGTAVIVMAVPVRHDNAPSGTLTAAITTDALRQSVLSNTENEPWVLSIVDRKGRIVTRSSDPQRFIGKLATGDLRRAATGSAGNWRGTTIDGTSVIAAYARSGASGFIVAAGAPASELDEALWRPMIELALIGLLAVALSLTAGVWLSGLIIRTLDALATSSVALAGGKIATPVRSRVLELRQLSEVLSASSIELDRQRQEQSRASQELRESRDRLSAETSALSVLNSTNAVIASELDLEAVVQRVTDAAVELTGAKFGAFFYNVLNERGEALMLYTLSGAARSDFESFGMPRATAVFAPTFNGDGVIRSDDITADARYGNNHPHHGMPSGHLPVRSYLSVPVRSRNGDVVGGLFFGHPEAGVFDERAERLAKGIAAQAGIAIENARLYREAQREIGERKRAEQHQRLLIDELNHRVKNSLAIVQGIAQQTFRSAVPEAREAFEGRLAALSTAHDLLTRQNWESASLNRIVADAVGAVRPREGQVLIDGPDLLLAPKTAVSLAMAIHELSTNSVKYGSLSVPEGRVEVRWASEGERLKLTWRETRGPLVQPPAKRGFGTRMIERGLSAELGGNVAIEFLAQGVVCTINAPLPKVS